MLPQDFLASFPKPHILNGLKQAYLRTSNTPTGLGIAFEKAVKKIRKARHYYLKIKVILMKLLNGQTRFPIIIFLSERVKGRHCCND